MTWRNIFVAVKTAASEEWIVLSESTTPTRMPGPMPKQSPSISQTPDWAKGRRVIPPKTKIQDHGFGVKVAPETGIARIPRPKNRTCAFEDCEQQLSMYNRNRMCFMHMRAPTGLAPV